MIEARPLRQQLIHKPWLHFLSLALILATLLTMVRAFSTGEMAVLMRFSLWLTVSSLLIVQFNLGLKITRRLTGLGRWHWVSVFLAFAVTLVLFVLEVEWLKSTPLLPKAPDPFWPQVWFLLPIVLVVCLLILLVDQVGVTMLGARPNDIEQGDATPQVKEQDDLMKLSVRLIQVDEHYLHVRTKDRALFIRKTMKQAASELMQSEGMQVHRSWWVHPDMIKKVVRQGRDYRIKLHDGRNIPVARSRVDQLKQRGWLNFK